MNAMPPKVVTFGCRLNALESEVLRERLGASDENVVIFNTCAVTAEAVRQARQAIRRARRQNPKARIVVTGCAAQIDPGAFAAMPEVDRVVGNRAKLDPAQLLGGDDGVRVDDIMSQGMGAPFAATPERFSVHTRAFVQVQQGCDHRCTFCVIPFARGPSRSVPMESVVERVRAHVAAGHAEAVLTGVDISSYGADLPGRPSLGALARRILADIPDLKRLRLSSLDPAVADEDLFRALASEDRLMPHLHLSLQSLDDTILKRMKRRHNRKDAFAFMARARAARPGLSLGADLIAGFPTETEAMFATTLAAIEDAGIVFLHVFPYSPRLGTPSARMPQVAGPAVHERAARLRRAGDAALARFFAAKVGAIADVLVEKGNTGFTPDYAPVRLGFGAPAGAIIPARLARVDGRDLVGEIPR